MYKSFYCTAPFVLYSLSTAILQYSVLEHAIYLIYSDFWLQVDSSQLIRLISDYIVCARTGRAAATAAAVRKIRLSARDGSCFPTRSSVCTSGERSSRRAARRSPTLFHSRATSCAAPSSRRSAIRHARASSCRCSSHSTPRHSPRAPPPSRASRQSSATLSTPAQWTA